MTKWGTTQASVARALGAPADGRHHDTTRRAEQAACVHAADRGLLRRDRVLSNRFYATEKGWAELQPYEAQCLEEYLEDMDRLERRGVL